MFSLLSQPYPSTESIGRELRKAALIGLFVGLFLTLFQPFGLSFWKTDHKVLKMMGFGVVTFVVTAINFTVWQRLFPRQFSEQNWNVGREIGLVSGNILLIAIANRLYLQWLLNLEGIAEANGAGWVGMILVTYLIGLFPTTVAVLLSYVRRLRKYAQSAGELPVLPPQAAPDTTKLPDASITSMPDEPPVDKPLTLVADNEKDALTIQSSDLLFIESSDNYCTVVHLKNDPTGDSRLLKPLLRSSLSRLESQINRPHIVRCHRSFVVNLNRVERVTGNAQGYKLHLRGGNLQVPVSRQYNDTLVAELKSL